MNILEYRDLVKEAADTVENVCGKAEIAVVLGSGLGDQVKELQNPLQISYQDIPGFPVSTAPGHKGIWWAGEVHGKRVYMLQGRVHGYEGYSMAEVTMYVCVMKLLGVKTLILTNASGAVNTSFHAGDLMLITDHINLSGKNPLTGPNVDEMGPRFPDMTHAYSLELQEVARAAAKENGILLREGVYCWLNGPTYETPAEIRMVRTLGADAVGMSTVPETIVANWCGIKILGLSCLANMAAGILDQPLTEQEVLETGARVGHTFGKLVDAIIEKLQG